MGGALQAHYVLVINPSDLGFFVSLNYIIFLLFGGLYGLWGPVLAAIVLTAAPELLRFTNEYRLIFYGLIIVLVVLLRPEGLITARRAAPGVSCSASPWCGRARASPATALSLQRRGETVMKLIDLSRELYHKCPTHPKHPPFIMTDYNTHKEIRTDGAVPFSAHSMVFSMETIPAPMSTPSAISMRARRPQHRRDAARGISIPRRCVSICRTRR